MRTLHTWATDLSRSTVLDSLSDIRLSSIHRNDQPETKIKNKSTSIHGFLTGDTTVPSYPSIVSSRSADSVSPSATYFSQMTRSSIGVVGLLVSNRSSSALTFVIFVRPSPSLSPISPIQHPRCPPPSAV